LGNGLIVLVCDGLNLAIVHKGGRPQLGIVPAQWTEGGHQDSILLAQGNQFLLIQCGVYLNLQKEQYELRNWREHPVTKLLDCGLA